jgi:Nif-specific regulatory protein
MALLVEETLVTVAHKLRQVFRAERASAFVADRDGRTLRSPAALYNGADGVRVSIPAGEGPAGLAATRREAVHESAPDGPPIRLPHADALRGCEPRDVLAAPALAADGSVAGVIEVVNRAGGGAFTAADQQGLTDLARLLVRVLSRCQPGGD